MKKLLVFVLVVTGFAALLAAQGYTKQTSRLTRAQLDVTYSAGSPTSVKTTAFLVSSFVNSSNASDIVDAPTWSAVSFDMLDPTLTSTTITAGGKTVTYPQLAALMRQACLDRATASGVQ